MSLKYSRGSRACSAAWSVGDCTQDRLLAAIRPLCEALENRTLLTASVWSNLSSPTANWNAAGNWEPSNSYPGTAADSANLNVDLSVNQSITLGSDISLHALTLGSGQTQSINAGNTLTFDNGAATASLTVASNATADVTIAAPIALNSDLTIDNAGGQRLTLSGNINVASHVLRFSGSGPVVVSGAISGSGALLESGGGSLALSGTSTFSGTTTVTGGSLLVSGSLAASPLSVSGGSVAVSGGGSILPAGMASALSDGDIGNPGHAGSVSYDGTDWTFAGGGSDIWGSSDAFNFDSQPLPGNGNITVKLNSQQNTDQWAKSGVMIRSSSDPGAANVALVNTPGQGILLQTRSSDGGSTSFSQVFGVSGPVWLELTRAGNNVSGYYSTDDINWSQIGSSQNAALGANALIGVADTAHNDGVLNTSVFSDIALNTPLAPPAHVTTLALPGEVDLSWHPASQASSYNVLRSADGGGSYATIASNVTGTTYNDTTAPNGVAVQYELTSNSGGGDTSSNPSAPTPAAVAGGAWAPVNDSSGDPLVVQPSIFDGSAATFASDLTAGTYRVVYLDGTMSYSGPGYGNFPATEVNHPDGHGFYVTGNRDASLIETNAGGGTQPFQASGSVGVYLVDNPYYDNAAGPGGSPRFTLEELVPTVSIAAGANAIEAQSDGSPGLGRFTVTRSGDSYTDSAPALSVSLSVNSGVQNPATPGYEYQALPSQVSIASGQQSASLNVTPIEINHVEGTTNVAVSLAPGTGYLATGPSASVFITNTDDGTITIDNQTFTVGLSDSVPVTFKDHYGRFKAVTLTVSGTDSTILTTDQTITTTTDPNNPALLNGTGVAAGSSPLILADPAGNVGQQAQAVVHQKLTVTKQGETITSYEGQQFYGLATLTNAHGKPVVGQQLQGTVDKPDFVWVGAPDALSDPTDANGTTSVTGICQKPTAKNQPVTFTVTSPRDPAATQSFSIVILPVKLVVQTKAPSVSTDPKAKNHTADVTVQVVDAANAQIGVPNVLLDLVFQNKNAELTNRVLVVRTDFSGVGAFNITGVNVGEDSFTVSVSDSDNAPTNSDTGEVSVYDGLA